MAHGKLSLPQDLLPSPMPDSLFSAKGVFLSFSIRIAFYFLIAILLFIFYTILLLDLSLYSNFSLPFSDIDICSLFFRLILN
jgi:hypothetical protein